MMKRVLIFLNLVALLCGCAEESTFSEIRDAEASRARIVVTGAPGGFDMQTRIDLNTSYPDLPTIPGECTANAFWWWQFNTHSSTIANIESNLYPYCNKGGIAIPHRNGFENWVEYNFAAAKNDYGYLCNAAVQNELMCFVMLAYDQDDLGNYPNEDGTDNYKLKFDEGFQDFVPNWRKDHKLLLRPYGYCTERSTDYADGLYYPTPDLYFGYYKLEGGTQEVVDEVNGVYRYKAARTWNDIENDYWGGRIYRIVSQVVLEVTEVPSDVALIELYADRFPFQINLYGGGNNVAHGKFYPVKAATESQVTSDGNEHNLDNWVKLGETADFAGGKATVKSFLLPSSMGSRLRMKVTFSGEGRSSVHDIRPNKDYSFANRGGIYSLATPEEVTLKDTDEVCYVYRTETGRFYSVSNVRVLVRARYSSLVTASE